MHRVPLHTLGTSVQLIPSEPVISKMLTGRGQSNACPITGPGKGLKCKSVWWEGGVLKGSKQLCGDGGGGTQLGKDLGQDEHVPLREGVTRWREVAARASDPVPV